MMIIAFCRNKQLLLSFSLAICGIMLVSDQSLLCFFIIQQISSTTFFLTASTLSLASYIIVVIVFSFKNDGFWITLPIRSMLWHLSLQFPELKLQVIFFKMFSSKIFSEMWVDNISKLAIIPMAIQKSGDFVKSMAIGMIISLIVSLLA